MASVESSEDSQPTIDHFIQMALSGTSNLFLDDQVKNYLAAHEITIDDESPEELFWKVLTTMTTVKKTSTKFSASAFRNTSILPKEDQPCCTYPAAIKIISLIKTGQFDLLKEALLLLQAHKLYLHPITLPQVLDHCEYRSELWSYLLKVMGKRALWLANQNESWKWFDHLAEGNLESLKNKKIKTFDLFLRFRASDSPLTLTLFNTLSSADKTKALNIMLSRPVDSDELICRHVIDSRSTKNKALATKVVLMLDTPERAFVCKEIRAVLEKKLVVNQGMIECRISPEEELLLQNLDHLDPGDFSTKFYDLLGIVPPGEILGHLGKLKPLELIQQIWSRDDLHPLARALANNLSLKYNEGWLELMIRFWIKHYPLLNSQSANPEILFQQLDSALLQKTITELLEIQDEYLIEKITFIVLNSEPYLSRPLSDKVIQMIIPVVQKGLNRTDLTHLNNLLPVLAMRLDPRASITLRKQWPEAGLHYSSISKTLVSFRKTLETRYDLFAYISGLK